MEVCSLSARQIEAVMRPAQKMTREKEKGRTVVAREAVVVRDHVHVADVPDHAHAHVVGVPNHVVDAHRL